MTADIGLGLSVVATALWSGLLLTLTTILHPMFAPRGAAGFTEDMRRFLPIARRSPTNYVLVVALVVSPVVALVGLWHQAGSAPFVLTAAGLAATVAGPLLMSSRLAEPNYAVILSWDPDAVPPDWGIARSRYFRLNWQRAILTWLALGLFVAAAYLYYT
ncbi:hypothetical protein [Geodermatophilus sp. CPCC 206100]|uniref:hypothetical protein n=1 Tax=Geodermatophilus sp. CPCC 206100 TaxID=3020054 RepID=UPI003B0049ED